MDTDRKRSLAAGLRVFRRMRLRISEEQKTSIYASILDSSHIDIEYVALLTLSGLIALFGLLENSAAVIIGAMLISPLMNPILSAALALLLGDGNMGKRSAVVLACSIGGVIGITWLVASLTPLKQATPEILARTAPTLLDLFIAFLSGLAGTLALRGGSVALTILPGVAIAVAVVPPSVRRRLRIEHSSRIDCRRSFPAFRHQSCLHHDQCRRSIPRDGISTAPGG